MVFSVFIAGVNIRIQSRYSNIYYTCKDYLTDEHQRPDIEIVVNDDMIIDELNRVQQYDKDFHSLKSAESLLIHRLISISLLDYDALLIHGATIAVNDKAYLFSAKSGTGKTTHMYKWLKNVDNSFVVNGDKTILALKKDMVYACGSPWCGKENLGTNAMVPLKGIIMMERSEQNRVELITFREVFPSLLEQTFQPTDQIKMRKTLNLMSKLGQLVPFYKYYFNNFKDDAFQVSFSALTKSEHK